MQSDSEAAVLAENVSLTYRATLERRQTLRERLSHPARRSREVRTVQAVRDVSLAVPRGSFTAIIGSNGAGKSTLVRILAGILPPTTGRVTVRGRITTLLSTGIGFSPELSGRENIVIGGLALGMTPGQVAEREAAIIEFADLGEFIDFPIKTYSSGMAGRLGFSVAVHMDPDILLVDEGLSAGDAAFKTKATDKMRELLGQAGAIVLVTHALRTVVEQADQCIWMHRGGIRLTGEPEAVVDAYTDWVKVRKSAAAMEDV